MSNAYTSHALPLSPAPRRAACPRRQRGVVLIIALIVLVAMSLAGIALFRQVGTGLTIAGNLTFKQNATLAGDQGLEQGLAWLVATNVNGINLNLDQPPAYFSSWNNAGGTVDNFAPATWDWTNNATAIATDGAGNTVRYVIHRLCETANVGLGSNQKCVTKQSGGAGGSQGAVSYGVEPLSTNIQPYFRITAAIDGPRSTKSYTQLIMY
jgi:type IV pilus assembly protein PilX